MDWKSIKEKLKWLDPFTYVDLWVVPRLNPGNKDWLNWVIYLFFAFLFAFVLYTAMGMALGTDTPMVIVVSGSMEPTYYRGDVILLQGITAQAPTEAPTLNAPLVTLERSTLRKTPLTAYAMPLCTPTQGNEIDCQKLFKQGAISVANFNTTSIRFENGENIQLKTTGDIVVYDSVTRNQPIIHRTQVLVRAGDGYYVLTKGDSVSNPLLDQDPNWNLAPYAIPIQDLKGRAIFRIPFIGNLKLWVFDDLPAFIGGLLRGR